MGSNANIWTSNCMSAEAKFQSAIMRMLPGHAFRVENAVSVGMPDINVCYRGIEIWIEVKSAINGELLLRPYQRAFMELRTRAGGECFIVALWPEVNEVSVSPWPMCLESVKRFGKNYLHVIPTIDQCFKKDKGYLQEIRKRLFQ